MSLPITVIFCKKPVQYKEYLLNTVDTDGRASVANVLATHPYVSNFYGLAIVVPYRTPLLQ